MAKTAEQLQTLLEAGDPDRCVEFFVDATERERQSLAKRAEAWLRNVSKNDFLETSPGTWTPNPLLPAAQVAALATCSLSTVKSLGWRIFPGQEHFLRVLADRRPPWLDQYAEALLDTDHPAWVRVRSMMKAGLCGRPRHDNYLLGMVGHFAGVGGHSSAPSGKEKTWNVLTHLLAEPDLLDDVWRLFEIEGGGEYSLAAHDKFSKQPEWRWDMSLVELSKQGKLSRQRLLDASLDALERGFAQFRAGWFSAFHELLEPTVAERLARTERYLRLLASPIPPTVSFALSAIEIIDKQRPLAGGLLADGLRPLMLARHKGTVKSALKLLERVAVREPALASAAARCAAEALRHETPDVQSAALKLIEQRGDQVDREVRDAVCEAEGVIAASLRERVAVWLAATGEASAERPVGAPPPARTSKARGAESVPPPGTPSAVTADEVKAVEQRAAKLPEAWRRLVGLDRAIAAWKAGALDVSACEFDGTEFPRLDPAQAICPIETLDEMIDAALAAIENPDEGDRHERVLDGISRLCDQRPGDFDGRTGPLRKRAQQLLVRHGLVPMTGDDDFADLLGVILSWLSGQCPTYKATKQHGFAAVECALDGLTLIAYRHDKDVLAPVFAERARAVAERAASRQAGPLLSAPTHAGGWIAPSTLAARVQTLNGAAGAGDVDQVLALLRLAPDGRAAALPLLRGGKGEFVAALRYALGETRVRVGDTAWLWAAAARARSPWSDDAQVLRRHPDAAPDAGRAAQPVWRITKRDRHCSLHVNCEPAVPAKTDHRLLSVLLWQRFESGVDTWRCSVSAIHTIQSVRPMNQEAACAIGAVTLAHNLDWWEAAWPNRTYLEPLLDTDTPLRPMALLLLAVGLAAKEPGEHGLATDAAIAAIADGRLDGVRLGTIMADLLPSGRIKGARWAKTLGAVSRVSPLHAEIVRDALARSLRGDPRRSPKDLHALVELLKELVAETRRGVDSDACTFLGQLRGSGKLAQAAQAILAFNQAEEPVRTAALQHAVVEQRLSRLERWLTRVQ